MTKDDMRKLYPITKLFICLALLFSLFIISSYIYNYCMAIICGVIAVGFGVSLKTYVKRIFFSLFWLLVAIFIIQSIFLPSGEVLLKVGIISVYKEGLFKAITPAKDFTIALEKKGLNPKAAFILLLSLQMIPEMKKQANVIMNSQKSRGVETEGNILVRAKALIPVFIPLVLSSIVNTEEKAITLEARGFSIGEKRTILDDIKETEYDKKVKIFLVVFLILCIIWRVYVLF